MERFDPDALARVHEDRSETGRSYVLRRGIELAARAAVSLSQPGALWIDAGCGVGHLTARLKARGLRVMGVDLESNVARAAQARWEAIPFTAGDAMTLPFREASADGVVAVSLAGCLDDLQAFLSEARRVLRPGGVLVLTVSNRDSQLLRINGRLRRILDPDPDPRRYRLYRAGEITEALRAAGLQPVSVRRYGYVLNLGAGLFPPAALAERFEREGQRGSVWARNLLITARR